MFLMRDTNTPGRPSRKQDMTTYSIKSRANNIFRESYGHDGSRQTNIRCYGTTTVDISGHGLSFTIRENAFGSLDDLEHNYTKQRVVSFFHAVGSHTEALHFNSSPRLAMLSSPGQRFSKSDPFGDFVRVVSCWKSCTVPD